MVGYSSENGFALLIKKSIFLSSKKGKKHFRSPHLFASKKDDLLFWESPTIKKKPPYFKVHASCTASKSNEKLRNDLIEGTNHNKKGFSL